MGVKLMDEATRAAQLADQLQLTQRTANKLAVEVEGYRKDADDFNAKQALAHLQLKAAQEKIETLTEQRDEAESKADERVKAKANEVTTMRRAKERAEARAAELEAKLSETEARLELEVAGSLAAAKREAMAMLDPNYDPNATPAERHSDEEDQRDALADAAVADDDVELDVFLPSGSAQAGGAARDRDDFGFLLPRRWKIRTRRRPGRSRAARSRIWTSPGSGCRRTTRSASCTTGTTTSRWRPRGSCRRGRGFAAGLRTVGKTMTSPGTSRGRAG